MDNIGFNVITNEHYKWVNNNMVCLGPNDYDQVIWNHQHLFIRFPFGINGLYSEPISYTNDNGHFTLHNLLDIIQTYYSHNISDNLFELIKQNIDNFADIENDNIVTIMDLLDYCNMCFYDSFIIDNGVGILHLGS